ncbi:MAG TPA: hypothetical protein VFY73_13840 [Ideonella sp.]|uniref:hypothetical protein n=1 Tax=Ideonella sp. TaxID=1929293 RepID=UPI002E32C1AE|nr:hypothetical protein [Ideonella sp.]HEX5685099.1 hypothetical protein [Ideonella sp.]
MIGAKDLRWGWLAISASLVAVPASAATGIQIGASGKTYASAAWQCGVHPEDGMAPYVNAGLYNARKKARGTVALNGIAVATVSAASPDATVWLGNGLDAVTVATGSVVDSYPFDVSTVFAGQPNICIPDTRANTFSGDLEYAASFKSYAVVTPGCAFNPLTGRAQPFVNLFDNGRYLLNVSVNNVPLTQLNGTTRMHVPVFLSAGLNVISAANGALSTDYYVRDGGAGTCLLP